MIKSRIAMLAATAAIALAGTLSSQAQMAAEPLTDANIGAIVVAANQIDIDYGKLALAKSKNPKVRAFAERMITDHSAVQKSVFELAGKLGLTPQDNAISLELKKNAAEITAKLKTLKGEEFDRFYIDNEAAYHKQVTDAVEAVLIPSANNLELKAALVGAQPLFLKHLEHVRAIQEASKGMGAMGAGMQSSK